MNVLKTLAAMALIIVPVMADAQARSRSEAESASTATSYGIGQSTAGASVQQIYNNSGKSQVEYSGSYDVKNVPGIAAPGVVNTAPCMVGISGGLSVMGGGASFGGGLMDDECNVRAEAQALMALGGNELALQHLARNDASICVTLRGAGKIPSNSVCTDAEKRAYSRAATTTASAPVVAASATASATAGTNYYSKCEKRADGAVVIRYKSGVNKETAKKMCLKKMGY